MKPALLIQPSNVKLLKLKKSDRKGAEFMLQNSMLMIRVRIADLTQQLAPSPSHCQLAVAGADSLKEHICKVFDSIADTLLKVRDSPISEN